MAARDGWKWSEVAGDADVSDILERMRRTPAADWTIAEVAAVCI